MDSLDLSPLEAAMRQLVADWHEEQFRDLAPSKKPSKNALEAYIDHMCKSRMKRIQPTLALCNCLREGQPDDVANARALEELASAYVGLEKRTPIFTTLALSKRGQPDYTSGWPLCAIRLVAETFLPQSQRKPRSQ